MNCKNCGKIHNGNYGSGRFCNEICARGFARKGTSKYSKVEFNCLNCSKLVKRYGDVKTSVYCSRECHQEYVFDLKYKKWIDGEDNVWRDVGSVRKALNRKEDYRCSKCGISDWNGEPLSLHLDHIDGNRTNHICPQCKEDYE